jgi:hypothetical protein
MTHADPMPETSTYASFTVLGNFSPEAVSVATGLEPTYISKRSVPTSGGKLPKQDAWSIRTEESETLEGTDRVREIVERMLPHRDFLHRLRADRGVTLLVTLVAFVSPGPRSAVPNLHLDENMINDLHSLGAEFTIDYSLLDPD